MNITISSSVQMFLLQFNFYNNNLIPSFVRQEKREKVEIGMGMNGKIINDPKEGVSATNFSEQILGSGFRLCDIYWRKNQEPGRSFSSNSLYFLFMRGSSVISENLKDNSGKAQSLLYSFTKGIIWRAKAFLNPFIKDGVEVPGKQAIVLVCSGRRPLVENNQRVMVPSVGGEKILLKPKEYLDLVAA